MQHAIFSFKRCSACVLQTRELYRATLTENNLSLRTKMAHVARKVNVLRSLVFLRTQVRMMAGEYGSGEGKVGGYRKLRWSNGRFSFFINFQLHFFTSVLHKYCDVSCLYVGRRQWWICEVRFDDTKITYNDKYMNIISRRYLNCHCSRLTI